MIRLCRMYIPAVIIAAGFLMGTTSRAMASPPPTPLQAAPITMEALLRTDQAGLETLYRSSATGQMPSGPYAGLAIPAPGKKKNVRQSRLIGLLWKGKDFPGDSTMVNRLAFGMKAVRADVHYGESWLDGGPTIVLDYANTSKLFGKARDEMREISPGLYLGLTYLRQKSCPKLLMFYTVQALPICPAVIK